MRKPEIHTVKQPKPTAKEIRDFVSAKEKETIKKASKGLLNFVKNHKKAIVGAGIGAAIPVGKTIARVIKNSKKSPRDRERLSDLSKVAENKMTRDQFSNKWYNK